MSAGVLDNDRVARPEPLWTALRRRASGRYPIDPFGLDPQLSDLFVPIFQRAVRVRVTGGEHVPESGPAVIVSNRGFGAAELAALGVAVERSSHRRLRAVGAPDMPFVGAAVRRLGAISSSETDVAAALRAGYLVGIPLSPTGLRTGAGSVPDTVARALTLAPIIPAAVHADGRFGALTGSWVVRFGPLVTLADPYDAADPIAAARFTDAMRHAVASLLAEI